MKTCTNCKRDGKGNGHTTSLGETIASLLKRNEGTARRLACKLTRNPEEAKELVQEASVRALTHWDSFDPVKSFQTWYLRIVKNAYLDSRRKYEFRFGVPLLAPVGDDEEGSALIDRIVDDEPGAQEQLERLETVSEVQDALKTLPAHHQDVLAACDMEGLGMDEAAQMLGIPRGTVCSRLSRARAKQALVGLGPTTCGTRSRCIGPSSSGISGNFKWSSGMRIQSRSSPTWTIPPDLIHAILSSIPIPVITCPLEFYRAAGYNIAIAIT